MNKEVQTGAAVLSAFVLVMTLAACTPASDPGVSPEDDPTCLESAPADGMAIAGTAVRDSLEGVTLTYAGYGGEFQAAQQAAFTDPFAACTGATVLQDASDVSKLRAMIDSGNVSWDVVYPGGSQVANACGELALDIDTDLVDVSDISGGLFSPCQVPLTVEPGYIAYNTEMFADNPPSEVADFFDTETYPGKRLIWGYVSYPDTQLWAMIGAMLGWTEESGEPFPHDEVIAELESIRDDLVFYETGAEQVQALEQGEVAFASVWAARAYTAAQNGATYVPIDNAVVYNSSDIFVPQGVKNPEAAFALMNYMMGAEQQAAFTVQSVYGPTNSTADPQIPEDMRPWVIDAADVANTLSGTSPFWLTEETYERLIADRQAFFLG